MMIFWPSHSISSRAASLHISNRQKRQNQECPPGVWSCKWKKLDDSGEITDSIKLKKRHISPERTDCRFILPGIWSCNGRLQGIYKEEQGYGQMNLRKRQNPLCPPGIWSCKNGKRNRFVTPEMDYNQAEKRQNPKCPPGIWSCKTKKNTASDQRFALFIWKRFENLFCFLKLT